MGLSESLTFLRQALDDEGPFVGVMGFSQGATLALALTSILSHNDLREKYLPGVLHAPFNFTVMFSGFKFKYKQYADIYSELIHTPVIHVYGTLDLVTTLERTKPVKDTVEQSCFTEIVHQGGHFVPQQKINLRDVSDFINRTAPIPLSEPQETLMERSNIC
jgi:predicted esterase